MSKIKKTALMKIFIDLSQRKAKYYRKLHAVMDQADKIWNLLSDDEQGRVKALLADDNEAKVDDEEVDEEVDEDTT